MKVRGALIVVAAAAIALMVDSTVAFGFPDGLGLLPSLYGAAAPPPAPAPAMPLPMSLPVQQALPPMFCAPPPPPPPLTLQSCGCPTPCEKGCSCGHPSCLSYLKPCLHAKILNLKKKLLEKKLTHLLSCCANYNSHLTSQQCCQCGQC